MSSEQDVRDVGSRKQLFIDDAFIASAKDVNLTMNPPYQDHEPVFLPEAPWEYRIHPYATVLQEGDTFRLWYLAYEWDPPPGVELPVTGKARDAEDFFRYTARRTCYAESNDGVHWTRPNLGLVERKGDRNNNILGPVEYDAHIGPISLGGGTVFKDPTAPPDQRYKFWSEARTTDRAKSGLWGFCSPDGLRWRPYGMNPIPGHADCLNVCFWDERIERYVGYSRLWAADNAGDRYRGVRRLVSPDFCQWEETGIAIQADEVDLSLPVKRNRESRQIMDFHGNCAFKVPGTLDAYIALPEVWWHWSTNPFPEAGRDQEKMGGFPDKVDVQMFTSRDGIHWQRAGGRRPFLRLGLEGAADSKMIYAFTRPIEIGNEVWVYYGGFRYGISEKVALKRGAYFRARLRLDGFVSADAPYCGGELLTTPLRFEGNQLVLNADTSGGGAIRVEMQSKEGRVIEGYGLELAEEINGNAIRLPVTWQGQADVRQLAGQAIRLRFVMHNCKLYSFRFFEREG